MNEVAEESKNEKLDLDSLEVKFDFDFSGRIIALGIIGFVAGFLAMQHHRKAVEVFACFLDGIILVGIGALPIFYKNYKVKRIQSILCFSAALLFITLFFIGWAKNGVFLGVILSPYLIYKGFMKYGEAEGDLKAARISKWGKKTTTENEI